MLRVIAAVVATAVLVCCARAGAQTAMPTSECPRLPESLRIGFVTFHGTAEADRRDGLFSSAESYLQRLSEQSFDDDGVFRCPVKVQIVLGNYYQIFTWLKSGMLDGAVVSAFFAWTLEQQHIARTFGELVEAPLEAEAFHYQPLIAVSAVERRRPERVYEAFLTEIWDASGKEEQRCEAPRSAQVFLVSHLSSSGFVAPIAHALRWLQRAHGDEAKRGNRAERFWETFFNSVRYTMSHTSDDLGDGGSGTPKVFFSYDASSTQWSLSHTAGKYGLGPWSPLRAATGEPFEIPPDRIVLSTAAVAHFLSPQGHAPAAFDISQSRIGLGYLSFRPLSPDKRSRFESQLSCIWGRAAGDECHGLDGGVALGRRYQAWYQDGNFRFPLPDLVSLLRQERDNTRPAPDLALILPGGGVKSAYQAKIIDRLYGKEHGSSRVSLIAANDSSAAPLALPVKHVIGTSGGAMMGLLTAQISQGTEPVAHTWSKNGHSAIAEWNVFPFLGPLRYVALFMGLLVFGTVLKYGRLLALRREEGEFASETRMINPAGAAPPRTAVALLGLFLLTAAAMVPMMRCLAPLGGYVAAGESVLFFVTVLCAHMIWACCEGAAPSSPKPRPHARVAQRLAAVFAALGMASGLLAILLVLRSRASDTESTALELATVRVWLPSLLGMLSVLAAVLWLTARLYLGAYGGRLVGVVGYLRSTLVLLIGLAIASVVFAIGFWFGQYALLELTPHFWLGLVFAAVMSALACTLWASGRWIAPLSGELRLGVAYLRSSRRFFGWQSTPASILVVFYAVALLVWVCVVSPALYDNLTARAFFKRQVTQWLSRSEPDLHSNLIVTASSLGPFFTDGKERPPGDVYFCFGEARGGCPELSDFRWRVASPSFEQGELLDSVFASGSPFPVFPPLPVRIKTKHAGRNSLEGKFVDGGYVHNVPLEAARLAGAGEALVIYSEPLAAVAAPDVVPVNATGELVRNLPRLVPFLFERSQEADRRLGKGLFVAGVAPRGDGRSFPFLTDFRAATIERMIKCAECDLKSMAPIGFVESWGSPRVLKEVGGRAELKLRHSSFHPTIKAALTQAVSAAPAGATAVFDMDNTLLAGDLGDALFHKLVRSLAYRGDLVEFWSLIANEDRRRELRDFYTSKKARALRASPPTMQELLNDGSYAELKAHFMLFRQEYEERLAKDEREGCNWAASTLMGLSEATVTDLTKAAWKEEGIQVRPAMKELVQQLRQLGFEVFIDSASNHYSVRFAAEEIGVDPGNAFGILLGTDSNGLLTSEVKASTYGIGKVQALSQLTKRPWLVAGDSTGDRELLKTARAVALVVDRGKFPIPDLPSAVPCWLAQPPSAFDAPSASGASTYRAVCAQYTKASP